jgi:hypothetical protein
MMVKKYLNWIAPTTDQAFTHTEVWKSTNQGVSWEEFTTANDPDYGADGILLGRTWAVDLLGDSGHWYKIRFYDNENEVYSDFSDYMRGSDFRGYCTILDVRNYTNVQTGEYSDAAVQMLIDTCTASIDSFCNRTWQGITTVTDQYLDGNGSNFLPISTPDLRTVTALAIDQDGAGTFTDISESLFYVYTDRGGILLDDLAEVSTFPNGRRRVKISYTYGFEDPTDNVRHLCILMVANMMKMDTTRTAMIQELKSGLIVGFYQNTDTGACEKSGYS